MKYTISFILTILFLSYPLRAACLKLGAKCWKISTSFWKNLRIILISDVCVGLIFLPLLFLRNYYGDSHKVFEQFFLGFVSLVITLMQLKSTYQSNFKKNIAIYLSYFILFFIFTFAFVFSIRHFIAEPYRVVSEGMSPTFENGDRVLIKKYDKQYKKGDVVLFIYPPDPRFDVLQRIIGLPGETVQIKDGNILIDGKILDESSYLKAQGKISGEGVYPLKEGEYFMLGDNHNHSYDSRGFGAVSKTSFIGKFWKLLN